MALLALAPHARATLFDLAPVIPMARERLGAAQVLLVHLTDAVAENLARNPIPNLLATYDGMIFLP